MRAYLASVVKAVVFCFILFITGPIALVLYGARRWTGKHDGKSFGNVLAKVYGWPSEAPKISETTWLNGLRGSAATMVMFHHLNGDLLGNPIVLAPFGATLQEEFRHGGYLTYHPGHRFLELWRLPILRLFAQSGDGQVAIFFILSGFVLAWSPLKMIYSGKQDQASSYLGSLMFRRWFRLYLPCFFVAALYLLAAIIRQGEKRSNVGQFVWELWNFVIVTEEWQRPFYVDTWKALKVMNIAMWTIPWEYAGSMYLVVVLLCAGRFPDPIMRMCSIAALSFYATCITWWVYGLFGFGIILCDYVLYRGGFDALSKSTSATSRALWTVAIIIGLYILGFPPPPPNEMFDTPGYRWMRFGSTSWLLSRYWAGMGAMLFVTGACHLVIVRKLFDTTLFQYLGRISFMLYLIHNLIIQHIALIIRDIFLAIFVSWRYDKKLKQGIYNTGSFALGVIWVICTLHTIALTLVAANWLEIYIDQPCTRFSRKIDRLLTSGTLLERDQGRSVLFPARHLSTDIRNEEESLPLRG